jgi:hypothetical protein
MVAVAEAEAAVVVVVAAVVTTTTTTTTTMMPTMTLNAQVINFVI